jgi:hypothetical protein
MGDEHFAPAQPDTAVPEPPAPAPSGPVAHGLSVARVLALQRSAGNHAVGALLASRRTPAPEPAMGGLVPGLSPEPDEGEDLVVGGVLARNGDSPTTAGGTGSGSGSGSGSGTTTGSPAPTTPVTISTSNQAGPTWSPHGRFTWDVGFTTSGRSGWIVQEIVNTFNATDSSGSAITGTGIVPHYWEAWKVDASGVVSPSAGAVNDMWRRPGRGNGSKGTWSMVGNCHFTTTDPATQGFTPGGVSNAGILLSTATAPTGLGSVLLGRNAKGTWDSTGATPTHTGTAGP